VGFIFSFGGMHGTTAMFLSWYRLAFPWSSIALTSIYCDGVCFALILFRSQICRPYTGRTYQLRLHLQHLGYPIANDPNYGGDMWYGNPSGRHAAQIAQLRLDGISQVIPKQAETEQVCQASSTSTTMLSLDVPATEAAGFWRDDKVWIKTILIQFVRTCSPPTDTCRVALSSRFL
jgi:hypothetical protein